MNEAKILFHNIKWSIREIEHAHLYDSWEEFIQQQIIDGYLQGQFEVFLNGHEECLYWEIDFSKKR